MTRWLLILAVLCGCASAAAAQTSTVSGTVLDPSGAVVPGAAVVLTGPAGAVSTVTGAGGDYVFRNVAAGTYRITVTLAGFGPATRADVVVGAAASITVPAFSIELASLNDTVVVSASKSESALIDAPATMSVVTSAGAGKHAGAELRRPAAVGARRERDPAVGARRQRDQPAGTTTLSNSQLVLLDGRSVYLDFFGLVLWDFLPTNVGDIKQIEVIRGPASAVWGANALNGRRQCDHQVAARGARNDRVVHAAASSIATRARRSEKATGAIVRRQRQRRAARRSARLSYRISAGYFNSDPLPRPAGTDSADSRIRAIRRRRSAARQYPVDASGALGHGVPERGTSQPKFDARVDQEINGGRVTYQGGVAGSSGIIHTGIGPFDIQSGSYIGYGKVNYRARR